MDARHLPQDLVRSSRGLQELAQTMQKKLICSLLGLDYFHVRESRLEYKS